MLSQSRTKAMNDHLRLRVLGLMVALASQQLAWADAAEDVFTLASAESKIVYHVVHKLHRVDGMSRKAEGRTRILPTGHVQVSIRASVESFDSGNSNRDSHMKETVEAARFPVVELKASCDGMSVPASFPATVQKTCKAQITFHGVQKVMDIPVQAAFESARRIDATQAIIRDPSIELGACLSLLAHGESRYVERVHAALRIHLNRGLHAGPCATSSAARVCLHRWGTLADSLLTPGVSCNLGPR